MSTSTIVCPHCHEPIELTDALSHQIREGVVKEFEDKLKAKDVEVEKQKRAMWEKAQVEAKKKIEAAQKEQMKELEEELVEKTKKLDEARKVELEIRKQQRQLEEDRKDLELQVARKLDEERKKVTEDVLKKSQEEHALKDREKEKVIQDLQKSLEDAQRKAAQGSQQTQGEVQELALEELLKSEFPYDEILEVAKGVRGADAIQKVRDQRGRECGTIVWESKRTKAWTDGWIPKLKEDQRASHADVAVLVTEALPKDITNFGYKSNVWITNYPSLIGVVTVLRTMLIQLSSIKQSQTGKDEKMEALYNYLIGTEFRQKIEAIVDGFTTMRDDLQREKDAFRKLWAKREKQIQQVLENTIDMHGSLQGLIGKSLPEIGSLELPAAEDTQDTLL
ncbi:MAG: DUF2130 domain-containing protein [Patescibacteria group bacterium]|jgi:hypothetical protein